ncbi:hypothetical protein Bca4012_064707 [Brassica carinata]
MMDTASLDLAQEAMGQFREEDGGQDAVDDLPTPICLYPGDVFEEQLRLDPERIRPSVVEFLAVADLGPCSVGIKVNVAKLLFSSCSCSWLKPSGPTPSSNRRQPSFVAAVRAKGPSFYTNSVFLALKPP